MRFPIAWAGIAAQNSVLKFVTFSLSTLVIALGVTTTKLALKKPLIIDRACYSKAAVLASSDRSEEEVKTFVGLALEQRFNTKDLAQNKFISDQEKGNKLKEQEDLKTRLMTQRVLVNSVKVSGSTAQVEADRLITVGSLKSVLSMNLTVTLSSVPRSEENPYGLILMNVSQNKSEALSEKISE